MQNVVQEYQMKFASRRFRLRVDMSRSSGSPRTEKRQHLVRFLVCNLASAGGFSGNSQPHGPDIHELGAAVERIVAGVHENPLHVLGCAALGGAYAGAIYVLRDPADVMLSNYHYANAAAPGWRDDDEAALDRYLDTFIALVEIRAGSRLAWAAGRTCAQLALRRASISRAPDSLRGPAHRRHRGGRPAMSSAGTCSRHAGSGPSRGRRLLREHAADRGSRYRAKR